MAIQLNVRTNIRDVLGGLSDHQRRKLPVITAIALTTTSKLVEDAERREIRRVFDRPVEWTTNSLYTRPATKDRLHSSVGFKDWASKGTPAGRYLRYHIDGGPREHKRFEKALIAGGAMPGDRYAVPTRRAPLDNHGNVSGGVINKILSDLQVNRDPTQNRRYGRRSSGVLRKLSFFAIARPTAGLAPGIYQKLGEGRQILWFAYTKRPTYRKRFDWTGVARKAVETGFAKSFRQAAQQIGWGQMRKAA